MSVPMRVGSVCNNVYRCGGIQPLFEIKITIVISTAVFSRSMLYFRHLFDDLILYYCV